SSNSHGSGRTLCQRISSEGSQCSRVPAARRRGKEIEMKKRIIAAIVALCIIAYPAWAIFGISFGGGGDIVYDPTNYEELVVILAELVKSYEQLRAQYELELNNLRIVPVDMLSRYRTLEAAWYGLQLSADRFRNLGGWVQAVNNGGPAVGGYTVASIPLRP